MKARFPVIGCLVLALPACGGGGDGADGEGVDAGTGADSGASDGGRAVIGACAAEYPVEGVHVVFHDANGAPLGVVPTNGAGRASFDACVDGGMVTLVRPASEVDATRRLFTAQGVSIGDVVRFTTGEGAAPVGDALALTVQNNLDEVTDNAAEYVGTLGDCTPSMQALPGSSGGALNTNDLTACLGDDPTTLVALSIARTANDQPLGFARSSTTDLSSPSLAGGGTWVAWSGPTQVMVTNVPAGATSGFRTLIPKIDGVDYGVTFGSAPLAGGPLSLAYWPSAIADEHRIALSYGFGAPEILSAAYMRTSTQPTVLDASEMLLARPTSIVTSVALPTGPRITWQGGDDRADYTRAELFFTDDAGPGIWILVAPGNPRELQVPALDEAHADLAPAEGIPAALRRLLLIDRETTYAAHLAEGLLTLAVGETYELVGVQEVAGTTLRLAGYNED